MSYPIKPFQVEKFKSKIYKNLENRTAPGVDLVTGTVLKKLPDCDVRLIPYIYNAIQRLGYFPPFWGIAQIILIPKYSKPTNKVTFLQTNQPFTTISRLLITISAEK